MACSSYEHVNDLVFPMKLLDLKKLAFYAALVVVLTYRFICLVEYGFFGILIQNSLVKPIMETFMDGEAIKISSRKQMGKARVWESSEGDL